MTDTDRQRLAAIRTAALLDIDASATHICVMGNPRLNIVVTPPQHVWLKAEAKRLGITVGDLIRRILDQVRGK